MQFLSAFGIGMLLFLALRPTALKLKIVDYPGELKIHNRPIPYLGGVGIFLILLFEFLFGFITIPSFYLLFSIIILLIGLWDDIASINPKLRFYLESALGILIIAFGIKLRIEPIVSFIITWLFFMGTINSVNWMDGMDGLLAGISIIVSSGFLWLAHSLGHTWLPQFALVFIGALLGFLISNFHPARIFLGDAGSYFIGFTFFYMSMELLKFAFSWKLFFIILGLLSIFIVDSTMTVIRRIRNGLHPFLGDRSHIYDQIYKRTGNYLGTVFLMYALAGVGVTVGLITYFLPDEYWIIFWISSAIAAYAILFKLKFVSITIVSDELEMHGEKS